MATRTTPYFCPNCRQPTLHIQHVDDCPNTMHAILTVLCCLLWAPVWMFDHLRLVYRANRTPYLCTRCGHPSVLPGGKTPPQSVANRSP